MAKAIETKKKERDETIDTLRALSIVVMMVMHVNAYYLSDKISLYFWSYSQWVVPAFLLCSFAVSNYTVDSAKSYYIYLKKRLTRLLVPYYLWLVANIVVVFLVTGKLEGGRSILFNVLLIGGNSLNWMILLFVYVTIFGPLIFRAVHRGARASAVVALPGLIFSSFVLFDQEYWYKYFRPTMILAWFAVTVILLFFLKLEREKKRSKALLIFVFGAIFYYLLQIFYVVPNGMRMDLFFHKYPPNIYFVAYCIFTTPIAYYGSLALSSVAKKSEGVQNIFRFISKESYGIFFIHTLVIYILSEAFPRGTFSYQQFLFILVVVTFCLIFLKNRLIGFGVFLNKYFRQ